MILWFTVLFANFAEAIAEGRGKAQADSLRAAKRDVEAHKIPSLNQKGADHQGCVRKFGEGGYCDCKGWGIDSR